MFGFFNKKKVEDVSTCEFSEMMEGASFNYLREMIRIRG
jgi:hypothetical protein